MKKKRAKTKVNMDESIRIAKEMTITATDKKGNPSFFTITPTGFEIKILTNK